VIFITKTTLTTLAEIIRRSGNRYHVDAAAIPGTLLQ
jgi:hypothetical protein